MGGCSGEVLTEIVTAEHGATEQIAEDGLLMFGQRVDENGYGDSC
jgi:hypothetical protein